MFKKLLEKLSEATRKLVQQELAQATLKEGATIEAESFEVGSAVFVVTEDEERMPLPEGRYEMEDGSTLVVSEESTIEAIEPAGEGGEGEGEGEDLSDQGEEEGGGEGEGEGNGDDNGNGNGDDSGNVGLTADQVKQIAIEAATAAAKEVAKDLLKENLSKDKKNRKRIKPVGGEAQKENFASQNKGGSTYERAINLINNL